MMRFRSAGTEAIDDISIPREDSVTMREPSFCRSLFNLDQALRAALAASPSRIRGRAEEVRCSDGFHLAC